MANDCVWIITHIFEEQHPPYLLVSKNPPPRDSFISPAERNTLMVALGYSEDVPVILKQEYLALAFLFAIQTAMRAWNICG